MIAESHDHTPDTPERRSEPRLRYAWQMYFHADEQGEPEQGRMIDLSASGAAFLARADAPLWPGKEVFLRITHPMIRGEAFDILEIRRAAEILRIEPHAGHRNRVAVRLTAPLDYDPVGDAANNRGATMMV